jgi:phage FluMu protein Com
MEVVAHSVRPLAVLETVRCLECGDIYAKPVAGGTVRMNPGCPSCGYVGWIPLSLPREPSWLRRSDADPTPLRPARLR